MNRFILSSGIVALLLGVAAQAQSGLVYDNGPINGTNAFFIDASIDFSLSEQFTLSAPAALTSAQAGLWVLTGATPASVDWAVGTTPFASDLGSGTSSTSNAFALGNVLEIFDIYESTFAIATGTLSAGTYYFTLVNAAASDSQSIAWDISNGPSVAYHSTFGNLDGFNGPGSNSESFQLFGNPVPAPSTFVVWLILVAIFGIGASYKRLDRLAGRGE
jgi:hypothetical protein